jgi:hypothetical protein
MRWPHSRCRISDDQRVVAALAFGPHPAVEARSAREGCFGFFLFAPADSLFLRNGSDGRDGPTRSRQRALFLKKANVRL